MPMTFPSHQGLIAPLWRRWPDRFNITALCVGAAMPDIVDGVIGIFRGHFGQGIGHSFLGLAVLGIPMGFALHTLVCRTVFRLTPLQNKGFLAYAWNLGVSTLVEEEKKNRHDSRRYLIIISLILGAFSHLIFDLVSHGHFPWLIPWIPKIPIFPDWWYETWLRIWLPWKPAGRKIGPHAAVWVALSIVGIWMLLCPAVRSWRKGSRSLSET
ncbi:MAG: DUF4184 family protein [Kiritimatiellae bacterium]|nr:DUF4184 family protein [Kiritimatiellia bacterium]MDD5520863.1 DUF4184 family protein [Kiritimatiellia bacterium]